MAIKDLLVKQGKVELVAEVTKKGDVREFEKFGKKGRVCNATIHDDTGDVTLTLWNDQIDQVDVGATVKISNGFVSEWQGEKQLSTGRFGTLEVVGKGTSSPPSVPSATQKAPGAKAGDDDEDGGGDGGEERSEDADLSINEEEVL